MKTRFSTIDIRAAISEIREQFVSLRAVNIYDVDNKTYIIKFNKPDSKLTLLLESGCRLHITEYEWPKNAMPSGFTMKLRKHLRSRRLESVEQLGADRIVDMQFGSGDAAYHIILELYDRGNIVLTDSEHVILNILRPRTDDSQDVKFAVKEKYPIALAKQPESFIGADRLREVLLSAQPGDNLRKILNPVLLYGPAVVEHCLLSAGFAANTCLGKGFDVDKDIGTLAAAIEEAEMLLLQSGTVCKGYIVQRVEKRAATAEDSDSVLLTYEEFHPFLLAQHRSSKHLEFETFNKAVDEFFSKLEAQKLDLKSLQAEKAALRKLDNVKKDHEKRIADLRRGQDEDTAKAMLIEMNLTLVDRAILVVNSAIANQYDWSDISDLVREAQQLNDPVAKAIKGLKLDTNHITLLLQDPYVGALPPSLGDEGILPKEEEELLKPLKVDIDLNLSAYANSKKYYDHRRVASEKVQKTWDASSKALRSAERTTKEMLKDAQAVATINKARRVYWFEKFLWLITSENFLAVGGRDAQQNEIIVKRHLRAGDVYVHADVHGAASIVIKNPSGGPIPPKTLNEVGCMAICNSAAWDAKVVTSAWWVHHDQVSKTAPTGEYLSTGSFMVRGKKNYLPPSYLVYGFGLLFKLDEESTVNHRGERRVRTADEEQPPKDIGASEGNEGEEDTCETELQEASASSDDSSSAEEASVRGGQLEMSVKGGANGDSEPRHVVSGNPAVAENVAGQARLPDAVSSDSDEEEASSAFPDTRIRLVSFTDGEGIDPRPMPLSGASDTKGDGTLKFVVGSEVLEVGLKVVRQKEHISARQRRDAKKQQRQLQHANSDESGDEDERDRQRCESDSTDVISSGRQPVQAATCASAKAPLKRGQKSKLRKMKEKYGDQDDEERRLRMSLLCSAPAPSDSSASKQSVGPAGKGGRKGGKPTAAAPLQGKGHQEAGRGRGRPQSQLRSVGSKLAEKVAEPIVNAAEGKPAPQVQQEQPGAEFEGDDEEKQDDIGTSAADVELLDSLTGRPAAGDILLFAIPFCAPYSVLQSFKYKVKLIPGTTKRGKAAKTAIQSFMHDRTVTAREKELLKALKDVDVSRNMPGKVKVSAPNLHKAKAK